MTCSDTSVEQLLADYFTGELSMSESGRVETHVARCESCRRTLLTLETISGRRPGSRYADGHIAPETLLEFFRQESGWAPDHAGQIHAHLGACDACRADWQLLSELTSELDAAAEAHTGVRRGAFRLPALHWLASPAVAWLLVAAAAYPTLSWIKSRTSPQGRDRVLEAVGPVQTLSEARRGQGAAPEVFRPDATALVRLVLPFGALPEQMDYRFTVLEEASGRARDVEIISNLSERGRVHLLLNTRGLEDGVYLLQATELDRTSGSPTSERGYRFALVTRP